MLDDADLENRKIVLHQSLSLEKIISEHLGLLLNIEPSSSYLFGNKSTSLSFNSKVLLLLDMKAIEKDEKEKLKTFMEIRNQFIHNYDANSFIECFSFLNGTENFLKKLYGNDETIDKEKYLEQLFIKLTDDIKIIIEKLSDIAGKKLGEDVFTTFQKEFLDNLLDSLRFPKLEEDLDEIIGEFIKKNQILTTESQKNLGYIITTHICNRIAMSSGLFENHDFPKIPDELLKSLKLPES